jgi:hypothetical protein
MPRVEFHCHTIYSKDSLMRPEAMLAACRRKGIDRIIVTDHNTLAGALYAQRLDAGRVIVGEEIMTSQGELLAAFVSEEIPAGLPPKEAIRRLREQGAFISVSHPFDHLRSGRWKAEELLEIVPLIDAIEIFNARCIQPEFNRQAEDFARQHGLAGTVGSDAHTAFELGRATLLLAEFGDAEGLRQALSAALPRVTLSSPWVHVTSRFAVWYKKRAKP